jgi:hypothetical protein
MKKRLVFLVVFVFGGCSYFLGRKSDLGVIRIKAEVKNVDSIERDKIRKDTTNELYNLIISYLSNFPNNFNSDDSPLYISLLKEKVKGNSISYTFEVDISKLIRDIKNSGFLRDSRKKICFVSDDYDFDNRNFIFADNFIVGFFKTGLVKKGFCNYAVDFMPVVSTITTAASEVYFSSFSFHIDTITINLNGVSNVSSNDSINKLLGDVKNKLSVVSGNRGYVVFRFYSYTEFDRMKKLYSYLRDKDFYVSSINLDFIDISMKVEFKNIEEEISRMIKVIPELSLEKIDSEKMIVYLKFIDWDLGIYR